eukprot:COSAG01_NODE_4404_length_5060_cov_11.077202_2_plen_1099_part_01
MELAWRGAVSTMQHEAPSSPGELSGLELRAELQSLKPRALYRRAEKEGVDESALDGAEDGAAVIELIMARYAEQRWAPVRSELLALKPRALQKRAEAEGVTEEELEEAADDAAIVALILGRLQAAQSEATKQAERREALRVELQALKPRALFKRAEGAGVDDEALDAAGGEAAVIELVLCAEIGPEQDAAEAAALPEGVPPQISTAVVAAAAPSPSGAPLNEPGHWDAMISYTQRNSTSETLAVKLSGELQKRGLGVWLDVEMPKRDEAAMQEGVQKSKCVIAIVSGPPGTETAYFRRTFCLSELRWAHEASVRVVPVVAAEDKGMITEFFVDIPEDLAHLKSANWEHIDRKDADYFGLGVDKILRAAQLLLSTGPEPEHGQEGSAKLRRIHFGDGNGGAGKTDPACTVFGSMRFPVPPEAMLLQAALKQLGVTLTIIAMRAGQDISKEVFAAIEHAETFLVFGTHHYGEDTGNPASSCREAKFAENLGKRIILLRMHPWNQPYEHLQARVMFNMNLLTLEWMPGQPMAPTLPTDIAKALSGSGTQQVSATPGGGVQSGPVAVDINVFVAHRDTTLGAKRAHSLQQQIAVEVGTADTIPSNSRAVVFLIEQGDAFSQMIMVADDPVRVALAGALCAEHQVVIPIVDLDFCVDQLEGLPDDIRPLARQRLVPIDWDDMEAGVQSLLSCLRLVAEYKPSRLVKGYLSKVVTHTETFKDPCTQKDLSSETQCVPLKLLTVKDLEKSRRQTTSTVDASDMLLLRRRAGLGGTIGYGDSHAVCADQAVREAEVHFAEAQRQLPSEDMMMVAIIVGPAACGKTTLLNRTTCGYAKDAMRGYPGALVPCIIRVMAFSRWLIQQGDDFEVDEDSELVMEYILHAKEHCNGRKKGLYQELSQLFEEGKLALIFDGLDEAGIKLDHIANYIGTDLGQNYPGRMIVSSRESLFDEQLFLGDRFQMLQIQPLTEAMQDDVLHRRFKNPDDVTMFKQQQRASENLREMGTNPLLLALQIGVFMLDDRQLPELRTQLYEKGVRMLLRRVEKGEEGFRDVRAQAAAVKLPLSQIDQRAHTLFTVLCHVGYLLHVDMLTRDFDVGTVCKMLQQAE